ncbi:hypothetical protein GCM10020295_35670 [Streptomyces cinereospinus]
MRVEFAGVIAIRRTAEDDPQPLVHGVVVEYDAEVVDRVGHQVVDRHGQFTEPHAGPGRADVGDRPEQPQPVVRRLLATPSRWRSRWCLTASRDSRATSRTSSAKVVADRTVSRSGTMSSLASGTRLLTRLGRPSVGMPITTSVAPLSRWV